MRRTALFLVTVVLIALTGRAQYLTPAPAPTATIAVPAATPMFPNPLPIVITPEPGTPEPDPVFNLHITITDEDHQPVKATIRLDWPDTGGNFTVGPTADMVLPIPADAAPFLVTVEAQAIIRLSRSFE